MVSAALKARARLQAFEARRVASEANESQIRWPNKGALPIRVIYARSLAALRASLGRRDSAEASRRETQFSVSIGRIGLIETNS